MWKRGRVLIPVITRDTSSDGLFITTGDTIAVNQVIDLTITLPSGVVSLLGVTRRCGTGGIGLAIFAMDTQERARWNAHCRGG